VQLGVRETRRGRQLHRIIEDAQAALDALDVRQRTAELRAPAATVEEFARSARRARRARIAAVRLADRETALIEESALIRRYRDLLDALAPDLRQLGHSPRVVTHAAIVPAAERRAAEELIASMRSSGGEGVVVRTHALPNGDLVLLIVMPAREATAMAHHIADARLPEVSLPAQFQAASLTDAVPAMLSRLDAIPRELAEVARERRALVREHGAPLLGARSAAHDALAEFEALQQCAITARAFAVEGWTPKATVKRLTSALEQRLGPMIVAEELATEDWTGEPAPVVLSNPRLFRPFEAIVRFMPLPRYGSIDPTPFVAVFFPVLFGLMLADVGYGVVLAALGLLLYRGAEPGTARRTIAEIIGPCAAFTIIGGFLFGELFGDFGRRVLGLRPILFDRHEAVVSFLLLVIGIGVVHVTLGLLLGVIATWRRSPRHAVGRGVAALMVMLIIMALLAAVDVLPSALLTPSVIAILVAFPLLIALEGAITALELLSTLGNMLSYARVMALGMASLMMAVVANRMAGAFGSAVVGFLFALLFHLVNFAIGVFSPTVHTLRLHYVEFFGKFYSPGGTPYHPFSHWRPGPAANSG
jgi:V/A-type H+-transporting ATPase subunit I